MAKEAERRIGRFGIGLRNDNGNRLVGLLSAARLFHGNSIFMKKEQRRWTWESPNGTTHAEIDHILTNRRWCLLDVAVVPSFCSGSDHRILRAKLYSTASSRRIPATGRREGMTLCMTMPCLRSPCSGMTGLSLRTQRRTTACFLEDWRPVQNEP